MEVIIKRPKIEDTSFTISEVFIDGQFFSHVIEDRDRGLCSTWSLDRILATKVKKETAIPYGRYQVILSFSNRFQKLLPLLLNVPGYAGIRIHAGNTQLDTEGCLCPGIRAGNKVINSRTTTNTINTLIAKRSKLEKVFVIVEEFKEQL